MNVRKTVTMRDIAQRANVSQTTVSFVLNKRSASAISDDTIKRVVDAARELGYRPNQMARALAKGRTDTIGVWLKSLHSSYYKEMVYHFDEEINKSDYNMTFARNAATSETQSVMQEFPSMAVDGIIAIDIPETIDYFTSHSMSAVPIVSYGFLNTSKVDCVAISIARAVRDALEYLYRSGRRSIAMMIDEGSSLVGGGPRLQEYLKFASDNGFLPNVITIKDLKYEYARLACHQTNVTNGSAAFDAILCYNDDLAIGALRGLTDIGLSVPQDVALVGCDNISETAFLTPSISTIAAPGIDSCRTAWQFLMHRLEEPSGPVQYAEYCSEFVAREST